MQFRKSAADYCWNLALKELSKTGDLSRDRLLDESLGSLKPRLLPLARRTRSAFCPRHGLLANNIDWSEAEWGNKTYLEPLLDGDEPLGELARTLLCLGLSAKEPGEHVLAADALAAAISDGRVDGQCLAKRWPHS